MEGISSMRHFQEVTGIKVTDCLIDIENMIFGYKNIYICDGSAFSSNPGVNPSHPITDMTERVMSRFQKN
jgi:cholesterol oxidase